MNCSPPGSSVYEIFQARILSGLPFPSPGDLPDPGIEPGFPALQADSLPTELQGKPKDYVNLYKEDPRIKENLIFKLVYFL